MAQQDILDYIRKTPHNSNVNVVKTMLNAEGGGGGAEPLIVNVTYDDDGNRFLMDKTFGEIRQAFNNGMAVVIVQNETDDTSTDIAMWSVYKCGYSILGIGSEYPSANGEVTGSFGSYSVACSEAPYTLEALDAQYPYMAD